MKVPAESFLELLFTKDIHKTLASAKVTANMQVTTNTQATVQRVHCPNCGNHAERSHLQGTVRTQCSKCDYLMTTCAETGRVIEAYAPSFTPAALMA